MDAAPKKFIPTPFQYHEGLTLTIQNLTNEGRGIGRFNNWAVMVPFVIPGETVRVRIFRNHKNYSEADLIEVLDPSPHRIAPKCPLFGRCGGCQYQHLTYEEQLKWKRQQIRDCLERIGKIKAEVPPVVPSEKTYGYRTKLTPHFDRRGSQCPIGFLAVDQPRTIVDVPHCPIASDAINAALPDVRAQVQASSARNGTCLLREDRNGILTHCNAVGTASVQSLTLEFSAGSFFQNNPYILNALVTHLKTWLQQHPNIQFLLDAYCGTGVFGLTLASQVKQFIGIESDEKSIHLARRNLQLNAITNGDFIQGNANALFANVPFEAAKTCLIMDPPRKGSCTDFLTQLLAFEPQAILYISCAPDTQARDLQILLQGSYTLTHIQPFDMFPQTKHIECLAILEHR